MKSPSLRRQKLRWCAEHNLGMREFQRMPVKYLLTRMPEFLRLFHQDYQRAQDNLNQYLSSDKPDYWKTRQPYVEELCHALSLSAATWQYCDFAEFKIRATSEYQALGLLSGRHGPEKKILLIDQLRQLPTCDGVSAISFDVERRNAMLAFRRSARHPINWRFQGDDRVRIRFHPPTEGHGLIFLIDPSDHCQILAPTIYQPDTRLTNGVLHIPDLHEDKFHIPEKIGCYILYAISTLEPPARELASTDGDQRLADEDLRSLIELCVALINKGRLLFRTDFLITPPTQDYD